MYFIFVSSYQLTHDYCYYYHTVVSIPHYLEYPRPWMCLLRFRVSHLSWHCKADNLISGENDYNVDGTHTHKCTRECVQFNGRRYASGGKLKPILTAEWLKVWLINEGNCAVRDTAHRIEPSSLASSFRSIRVLRKPVVSIVGPKENSLSHWLVSRHLLTKC